MAVFKVVLWGGNYRRWSQAVLGVIIALHLGVAGVLQGDKVLQGGQGGVQAVARVRGAAGGVFSNWCVQYL